MPAMVSTPPAVPGRPGSSAPPLLTLIADVIVPVPASVPPELTVMVAAMLLVPLSTTVPELTFAV
ncbi:MAG: hypothetical protein WAK35_10540 [Xanthobacteraceae bacterium]